MPLDRQVLAVIALCGWVGLWWLAVRIAFGRWFGVLEWVPVAVLAFGIPILLADMMATSARGFTDGLFLTWGIVAVIIDASWCGWRFYQWRTRRTDEKGSG